MNCRDRLPPRLRRFVQESIRSPHYHFQFRPLWFVTTGARLPSLAALTFSVVEKNAKFLFSRTHRGSDDLVIRSVALPGSFRRKFTK
jgi:hypothetical protein